MTNDSETNIFLHFFRSWLQRKLTLLDSSVVLVSHSGVSSVRTWSKDWRTFRTPLLIRKQPRAWPKPKPRQRPCGAPWRHLRLLPPQVCASTTGIHEIVSCTLDTRLAPRPCQREETTCITFLDKKRMIRQVRFWVHRLLNLANIYLSIALRGVRKDWMV